jgi:hypothetical protein
LIKLYGKIVGGKYPFMQALLDGLRAYDGREIVIEIKERVKRRSVNQERFYRGVLLPMIRDFENERQLHTNPDNPQVFSLDSIHLWCKMIMGRTKMEQQPDGEYREVAVSNADPNLGKMDYEKGNDKLRQFYAPLGLQLPYPNEVDYGSY